MNGRRPGAEELWRTVSEYGHFTAMQVRGGRTRGLALHLRRLEAATEELLAPRHGSGVLFATGALERLRRRAAHGRRRSRLRGRHPNIGFFDGSGVVWSAAPLLHGITLQLLERRLPERGVPSRRTPVHLSELASFDGAFLSNSLGIAAVSQVDGELPISTARTETIADAYASVSSDLI